MERYIGIVIRSDNSVAGVALQYAKNEWHVESSILTLPGRLCSAEDLDQVLQFDSADRIIIGCDFPYSVMVEMNVPPELPNEEALGMIRFQLGAVIPLMESAMICHARRMDRKLPMVQVAAIQSEDWENVLERVREAGFVADLITSPYLGSNEGVEGNCFYSPEFDSEFMFDAHGQMLLSSTQKPTYTEQMQTLVTEAQTKRKGNGRETLLVPAIQMAMLANRPITMLTTSVQQTLPVDVLPRRNLFLKRLTSMVALAAIGLLIALGLRYFDVYRENAEIQTRQDNEIAMRIQQVDSEFRDLMHACTKADAAFKTVGKPNRVFEIFSRIGLCLPFEIYIDNAKVSNDGVIQLTLKGEGDVNELQQSLATLPNATVIELNTQTQSSGGRTHNLKLQIKE